MRTFNELVAAWGDVFSLPLTALILILTALAVSLLWYFWPAWWHALKRMRSPGRARKAKKEESAVRLITEEELDAVEASEAELPDVEAAVFASLADRYAAEGRWAEAVRERLRAMVRGLVDRGVIAHHPGWTVTELAGAAGSVSMSAAGEIFSLIWYGKRPALAEHDTRMRALARQLDDEMSRR